MTKLRIAAILFVALAVVTAYAFVTPSFGGSDRAAATAQEPKKDEPKTDEGQKKEGEK